MTFLALVEANLDQNNLSTVGVLVVPLDSDARLSMKRPDPTRLRQKSQEMRKQIYKKSPIL